jgi:hypothetical protein
VLNPEPAKGIGKLELPERNLAVMGASFYDHASPFRGKKPP